MDVDEVEDRVQAAMILNGTIAQKRIRSYFDAGMLKVTGEISPAPVADAWAQDYVIPGGYPGDNAEFREIYQTLRKHRAYIARIREVLEDLHREVPRGE